MCHQYSAMILDRIGSLDVSKKTSVSVARTSFSVGYESIRYDTIEEFNVDWSA